MTIGGTNQALMSMRPQRASSAGQGVSIAGISISGKVRSPAETSIQK
jgi:hypothetical protein